MYLSGELPAIDAAIFADTGEEPKAVYEHLEWLKSLNGPPIIVRSRGRRLGDDLMVGRAGWGVPELKENHKHRFASIPAFTATAEAVPKGKVKRQCTKEYKVEVIEQSVRRDVVGMPPGKTVPKGTIVVQIAGISLDEGGRAARMRKQTRAKYWRWEFPLIEKFMTRQDCITVLGRLAPGRKIGRSACTFCPFHSDAEWLELKASPDDWDRAVQIDEGLRADGAIVNRAMKEKLYIHPSCRPLVQIDFSIPAVDPRKAQLNLNYNQECLGMCGV